MPLFVRADDFITSLTEVETIIHTASLVFEEKTLANAALLAMTRYKNQVEITVGSITRYPILDAGSTSGSNYLQAIQLGNLQVAIDKLESDQVGESVNTSPTDGYGYPNNLRTKRKLLIAALYALYQAEFIAIIS